MIAVDTNILVYAHRPDLPFHVQARAALERLAQRRWAIPWPCVHEFIATVTRARSFKQPTPLCMAFEFIASLQESSGFQAFLSEGAMHLDLLRDLSESARVEGAQIHDTRIAAICISHGVSELWTADRDFLSYPDLRIRNPLVNAVHE